MDFATLVGQDYESLLEAFEQDLKGVLRADSSGKEGEYLLKDGETFRSKAEKIFLAGLCGVAMSYTANQIPNIRDTSNIEQIRPIVLQLRVGDEGSIDSRVTAKLIAEVLLDEGLAPPDAQEAANKLSRQVEKAIIGRKRRIR